jgi:hypothetical protein
LEAVFAHSIAFACISLSSESAAFAEGDTGFINWQVFNWGSGAVWKQNRDAKLVRLF